MYTENRAKKPTIVLSIIWLVTFALCSLGSNVWDVVFYLQKRDYYSPAILDPRPVTAMLVVAFWFLPMPIVIHCLAKRARIKPIRIISLILMIFISLWLTMGVVFTMLALFGIGV